MAIYHLHVQIIGRSAGRTAIAAAAYRAGEKLYSQYTGETSDYRSKGWIEYSKIFLPNNAPPKYYNRETLWNSVESSEKSPNAQVAREVEVALPIELSKTQQEELIEQFVRDQFVSRGIIADVSIHRPPEMDDKHRPIDSDGRITRDPDRMIFKNPHAHILLTLRPLDDHGRWEPKTKKEYVCIRNGVEQGFTSDEYNQAAKDQGWEKQYKYQTGGVKKWMPESEGEALQLAKVSRDPKTTRGGRPNPTVAEWNTPERVVEWRRAWEEAVNLALKNAGVNERVNCRSYAEQGVDQIPQIHVGSAATAIDARMGTLSGALERYKATAAERAEINREIKKINHEYAKAKTALEKAARELTYAAEIVQLYKDTIHSNYILQKCRDRWNQVQKMVTITKGTLDQIMQAQTAVREADTLSQHKIQKAEVELEKLGILRAGRREELLEEIKSEKTSILYRKEHLQVMLSAAGIKGNIDAGIAKTQKKMMQMEAQAEKLHEQIEYLEHKLDVTTVHLKQYKYDPEDSDIYTAAATELEEELAADDGYDEVIFQVALVDTNTALGIMAGVDAAIRLGYAYSRIKESVIRRASDQQSGKKRRR